MQVSHQNEVKIYTISHATKSAIPDWLARMKKKSLRDDPNWMRRVELIQDFAFPEASIRLQQTRDGNYIMATGVYKPRVCVYDLPQASMKLERHTDAQNVTFEVLSDDWKKFVMLQSDRTVEFHSQHGIHYKTRIPKFGRDLAYHSPTCELLFAASGHEVYRLNLDQGRFLNPLDTDSPSINVSAINPATQMWAFGGEDSAVEFWDPRVRNRIGRLNIGESIVARYGADAFTDFPEITSVSFFKNGLEYAVGTKTGQVLLYDLRQKQPRLIKDHQYEYPICRLSLHESSGNIISADKKVIKIWNKDSGDLFTSIEPETDVNDLLTFDGSGLIMTANEGPHMNVFYCPQLGPAPKWCSFLDNLTEELEESSTANTWDDYKFVGKEELRKLSLDHLIGTNLLRAYMHGFFVDLRLYEKARAVTNPFEYDEYRRRIAMEKKEKEEASRIVSKVKLPKVNTAMAEKLVSQRSKVPVVSEESGSVVVDATNPFSDNRFADMFQDPDFEIDENDDEFAKISSTLKKAAPLKPGSQLSSSGEPIAHSSESELEGRLSDENSDVVDSDESNDISGFEWRRIVKRTSQHDDKSRNEAPRLVEVDGASTSATDQLRNSRRKRLPFSERLKAASPAVRPVSSIRKAAGAMSMTFNLKKR